MDKQHVVLQAHVGKPLRCLKAAVALVDKRVQALVETTNVHANAPPVADYDVHIAVQVEVSHVVEQTQVRSGCQMLLNHLTPVVQVGHLISRSHPRGVVDPEDSAHRVAPEMLRPARRTEICSWRLQCECTRSAEDPIPLVAQQSQIEAGGGGGVVVIQVKITVPVRIGQTEGTGSRQHRFFAPSSLAIVEEELELGADTQHEIRQAIAIQVPPRKQREGHEPVDENRILRCGLAKTPAPVLSANNSPPAVPVPADR